MLILFFILLNIFKIFINNTESITQKFNTYLWDYMTYTNFLQYVARLLSTVISCLIKKYTAQLNIVGIYTNIHVHQAIQWQVKKFYQKL